MLNPGTRVTFARQCYYIVSHSDYIDWTESVNGRLQHLFGSPVRRNSNFLEAIVPQISAVCIGAGSAIIEVYNRPDGFLKTEKSDRSPLTEADVVSHGIISDVLSELRLEGEALKIMSEEGGDIPYTERSSWKRYWLVDPLDGTKEFLSRNGEFTVNIALIENGMPVAGFIYVPVTDEMFVGIDGVGSVKVRDAKMNGGDPLGNGEILSPRSTAGNRTIIVASRSHYNGETRQFIERVERRVGEVEIVNRGSSAKFCAVADGSADLYPRFGPTMEWDTAAGDALCRSVGLEVRKIEDGKPLEYNKVDLHNPWFIVGNNRLIGMTT